MSINNNNNNDQSKKLRVLVVLVKCCSNVSGLNIFICIVRFDTCICHPPVRALWEMSVDDILIEWGIGEPCHKLEFSRNGLI